MIKKLYPTYKLVLLNCSLDEKELNRLLGPLSKDTDITITGENNNGQSKSMLDIVILRSSLNDAEKISRPIENFLTIQGIRFLKEEFSLEWEDPNVIKFDDGREFHIK